VQEIEITARCADGSAIFISSEGWLMPCCYSHIKLKQMLMGGERAAAGNRWFLDNKDLFDLSVRNADAILADARWKDLAASWANGTAPAICYHICGVPKASSFKDVGAVRERDSETTVLRSRMLIAAKMRGIAIRVVKRMLPRKMAAAIKAMRWP
jgi:hypothetical protein